MRALALVLALWLVPLPAAPAAAARAPARVAIVIDDLGNRRAEGERAIALPGPVAVAVLPHTPHARELAERAHAHGKEVLLHLPLAAEQGLPLGPGGIGLGATRSEFARALADGLAAVPHAAGVSNHMGSLLTREPHYMQWLMQALAARGLFFVDSYTTADSVALAAAHATGVPAVRRQVFLDPEPGREVVEREFARFVALARARGQALAIGHPHHTTLALLEERLPQLAAEGVTLVPVSALLETVRPPAGGAP